MTTVENDTDARPTVILAKTIMGRGFSEVEDSPSAVTMRTLRMAATMATTRKGDGSRARLGRGTSRPRIGTGELAVDGP